MGAAQLAYDANGNLREKGDFRFTYDYRNRLTTVSLADGTVLATYGYDAFNRRIRQEHASTVTETVYSGWQETEEYLGGQLHWRWSYGGGLDEVIRMEGDLDQDGSLETDYQPIYDSSGNLVQLTNGSGGLISKYFYSPFGEVMAAHIDNQAGQVDQLVWRAGSFHLEFSEAILTDPLFQAVEQGDAFLLEIANGTHHELVGLAGPTREGYGVERIVLTPETVPPPGVTVQLVIPVGAIEDHYNNLNTTAYEKTFALPAPASPDQILDDVAPPHVEAVYLDEGVLKITFSEQPDLAAATAAIQLNGNQASWTESTDQATLVLADALPIGTHSLQITTGPLDLAGQGLEEGFTLEIAKGAASSSSHLFLRPNDREVPLTVLSNYLGYHGRRPDVETGLIYFRNRYYDPELGRFISADPLEYVDGPSVYAFAMNDPANYGDPLGLQAGERTARAAEGVAFSGRSRETLGRVYALERKRDREVGDAILRTMANPYVSCPLMMAGGCPLVAGGIATSATGIGLLGVAYGADLCGTGLATVLTGYNQEPLLYRGASTGLESAGLGPRASHWTAVGLDLAAGLGIGYGLTRFGAAGVTAPQTRLVKFEYQGLEYLDDGLRMVEQGLVPREAGGYLARKAPKRVAAGTRLLEGHYVDDLGRVQPWRARYDEFGRLVGRTDFNARNRAAGIPDTHYHRYEYSVEFPLGREIERHVRGEFPGGGR